MPRLFLTPGNCGQSCDRLLIELLRLAVETAVVEPLGQLEIKPPGFRVLLLGDPTDAIELRLPFHEEQARGDSAERRFVVRVDGHRLVEPLAGRFGFAGIEMHVGTQVQRGRQTRIDGQRPLGEILGFLQFQLLQGGPAFADERLGRARVDGEGLVEGGLGLAPVVLLQQQHPRLILGRPQVGIGFESVAVHLVEDEAELIREVVPAGVLGPGLGDEQQRVRVLNRLAGAIACGVSADEPAKLGVGFL